MQIPIKKGDSVVLDSNVIVTLTENRRYKKGCSELLDEIEDREVELIIPRIVEYELLKRAGSVVDFYKTLSFVEEKFTRREMSEPIMKTAIALYALYHWDETARECMEQKKQKGHTNSFLHDLVVGSTAMHYQSETKRRTYILSADHDFMRPFFSQEYSWVLRDAKTNLRAMSFHLLRAEADLVIQEWEKHKAHLSGHQKAF